MSSPRIALAVGAAALALLGCTSVPLDTPSVTAQAPAASGKVRVVRSVDNRFDAEISGTPAPESRFAKLKIGMELEQVHKLIGGPDALFSHGTGKVWIPLYYGADGWRIATHHRGKGCLTYSAGGAVRRPQTAAAHGRGRRRRLLPVLKPLFSGTLPAETLPLRVHPAERGPLGGRISASLAVAGSEAGAGWLLSYRLEGDLAALAIPAPAPAVRADGLWRHTCFEAFVQNGEGPAYREFKYSTYYITPKVLKHSGGRASDPHLDA